MDKEYESNNVHKIEKGWKFLSQWSAIASWVLYPKLK
jgi:hypothetical protein